MDEQKAPRPDEEMQRQWREAMEVDSFGNEHDIWLSGFNRGKQTAALSQPAAAQVDSSHSAGGECGGAQVPDFWTIDYMGEPASGKFTTRAMAEEELERRNASYPTSAGHRSISAYIKATP